MIKVLTETDRPRKYWSDLKKKFFDEESEVSEKIGQLKLKAKDGKHRLTDVVDIEVKNLQKNYQNGYNYRKKLL